MFLERPYQTFTYLLRGKGASIIKRIPGTENLALTGENSPTVTYTPKLKQVKRVNICFRRSNCKHLCQELGRKTRSNRQKPYHLRQDRLLSF